MDQNDITHQLISEVSIRKNLTSIFTDAIIIHDNFSIAAVSDSILTITGFQHEELENRPLDYLSGSDSLQYILQKELAKGFSESGIVTALKTRDFGFITCQITGFYLGLISDMSGFIILRVKQVDEINQLNKQLENSQNDLDEFVYRAAHDLRGPLATIRGLVNLMKLKPSGDEMMNLVDLIDSQAIKMDDRLLGLHYLSGSSQLDPSITILNCDALESSLRATLEENHTINHINFQFTSSAPVFKGVPEQHITSIINNILLYLLTLPKSEINSISFSIAGIESGLRVDIVSTGFLGNFQLMKAIRQKAPIYSSAVTYTQLIHYFAAQKIAQKIKASLRIDFVNEDAQYISIVVPVRHP
ncbi:MAG: hypothetical protein C0490_12585 [Marivirga sp.]|nr:hypothetical protein [Marivirga sp.]